MYLFLKDIVNKNDKLSDLQQNNLVRETGTELNQELRIISVGIRIH